MSDRTFVLPDPAITMRELRTAMGIVSATDLAMMCNISEDALQAWRREGKGPIPVRLGRAVFYRIADVGQWVDDLAAESAPKHYALSGEYQDAAA